MAHTEEYDCHSGDERGTKGRCSEAFSNVRAPSLSGGDKARLDGQKRLIAQKTTDNA